jgi:hypothetical protein
MKVPSSSSGKQLALLFAAVILPVLFLFRGSFQSSQVLFSNDGTLGAAVSQADTVTQTFSGLWRPLNWVGLQDPSAQPDFTMGLFVALRDPVVFSKFYAPLALIFLGVAAWFFAKRAGFHPSVCALVGTAAALASNPVSYACWGLPPKAIALGCTLCALGLLLPGGATTRQQWLRVILAGFAVGLNVTEAGDVGALFSLYVAAYCGWQALTEPGSRGANVLRGGLKLAVVAICAAWIAAHSLFTLIGTQIVGVAGMQQTQDSRDQRWEFATWGSFPKVETLRFAVPGVFGYRMDTENGGAYWGSFGGGTPNTRFSGSGEYVGVLVLLVASVAIVTALRRERSPFSDSERRQVWFWGAMALASLLLALGKNAPFYQFFFSLPYFSTIRIPAKFLHGMNLALWVLFAFGLEALARGCLGSGRTRLPSVNAQFVAWKASAVPGERRWVFGALLAFGISVLAAALYSASAPSLMAYLGKIDFHQSQPATAAFSIREVWLAVLYFAASLAVVVGIVIGWFGGARAKLAWWLLGGILVVDLYRANTPWVKHYDYVTRYQSNPVIDLLKDKPWDQRVTAFLDPRRAAPLVGGEAAGSWVFLQKEWLEHHFQYFKIQSLDIDQMPRMPELEAAYFGALSLMANPNNPALVGRLWQLTNTRHVLGSKDIVDQLNQMLDPVQKRLRVKLPFALGLKPGAKAPEPTTPIADRVQLLTATPSEQGPYAVMEFTGALPRAKLYSDWQTGLSDSNTLETLRSPSFDPAQKVLLAQPVEGIVPATNAPPGDASIISHAPKQVVVKTKSTAAGVLLLNDRWHPDWKVTVDGQSAPLLRANFIMRGVAVPAGEHTVEFRFEPPHGTLWISLSAIVAGLVLVGLLVVVPEPKSAE